MISRGLEFFARNGFLMMKNDDPENISKNDKRIRSISCFFAFFVALAWNSFVFAMIPLAKIARLNQSGCSPQRIYKEIQWKAVGNTKNHEIELILLSFFEIFSGSSFYNIRMLFP